MAASTAPEERLRESGPRPTIGPIKSKSESCYVHIHAHQVHREEEYGTGPVWIGVGSCSRGVHDHASIQGASFPGTVSAQMESRRWSHSSRVLLSLVWSVQERATGVLGGCELSGRGVRKVLPVADARSQRDKRRLDPQIKLSNSPYWPQPPRDLFNRASTGRRWYHQFAPQVHHRHRNRRQTTTSESFYKRDEESTNKWHC